MTLFESTLSQLVFLFLLMSLGYLVMKLGLVPKNANTALSKLENLLFIPALMLGTFMKEFTPDKLRSASLILLGSIALELIVIPLAILISRLVYKTDYLRKIATYGLSFANFGFMGNAVMLAIFPEIFIDYSVFTLPLWVFIMLWGIPTLLLTEDGEKKKRTVREKLRPLLNPMLICMLVGMIVGITGIMNYIPEGIAKPITGVIDTLGAAMSPIAMLLTGMTLAQSEFISLIKKWRVYIISTIRLIAIPVLFLLIFSLIPRNEFFSESFIKCAVAAMAMPLGLNTIVIPTAYGKDTSDASSMALISHVMSVITIPLVFAMIEALI